MYQELVYWLLRCLPTPLPKGPLLAGVNDIVAGLCSEQVEVDFYTHHAPREAALVRALIEVLIRDFEHTESEWVLLLRRNPDRFFQALRKTKFCAYWMAVVKRDPEYAKIMSESTNKRDALIEMLRDENLTANSSFLRLTERALVDYSSESVSA
jgi:hypothetical protein